MHLSAKVFRVTAVAEACSWLGLLIGMFFKYVVVENEIGVKVFGPIHGALFVAYLASLLWVAIHERWRPARTPAAAPAAIPPFTSVVFERWAAERRATRATPVRTP
ncbi:hypothetical protein GCM10009558_021140 [Virgisporangium aurantiacum]